MADNRVLNGMNWLEQNDGSWVAITPNYKLVAVAKDPETVAAHRGKIGENWPYLSLLYRWDSSENTWVLIDKSMLGSVSMTEAKLDAERLLGTALSPRQPKEEREVDSKANKLFEHLLGKSPRGPFDR